MNEASWGHRVPVEGGWGGRGGSSPGDQVVHLQPEDLLQDVAVPDEEAQRTQAGRAHLLSLVQQRQT